MTFNILNNMYMSINQKTIHTEQSSNMFNNFDQSHHHLFRNMLILGPPEVDGENNTRTYG